MNKFRRLSTYHWPAVVLLLLAGCALCGPAAADEPKKKPVITKPAGTDFQIVRLRFTKAEETARLLDSLFHDDHPTLRIVPEERTNSLLIQGSEAPLRQIREMLAKIDIEGADAEAAPAKMSIFALRSLEPDKALQDSLRLVFGKKATGNFAVDQARKIVIVSADRKTTEAVEALLSRLDTLGRAPPDEDVQVRVVWLASAADGKIGTAVSGDLKQVLPALAKLGIDKPGIVGQLLVSAQPNTRFQAKGALAGDIFSMSGRLDTRKEAPGLEITIQATQGREQAFHLQTEISAPLGHLVVLGVTPTSTSTSAFVVQVLQKESKQPASR